MKKILLLVMLVIFTGMAAYADEAVVAKVNGAAITAEDLEGYTNQLVPRATFHGNISKEKRDELRQKALDGLIDRELQYQDAVSKGMKPDKKEVNERMDKVRGQFASRKDYQKALKDAGITEDQFRARAEKAVLIDANIRKSVIE